LPRVDCDHRSGISPCPEVRFAENIFEPFNILNQMRIYVNSGEFLELPCLVVIENKAGIWRSIIM